MTGARCAVMGRASLLPLLMGLTVSCRIAAAETAEITVGPRRQWNSKRFAVEEFKPYRLTFKARVDGEMTFERNAEMLEAFYDVNRVHRGVNAPRWEKRFWTADGRKTGWNILFPYWNSVFSSALTEYVDVFYAPREAVELEIVFINSDSKAVFYATEPVLRRENLSTVNVNPDFSLGRFCHAGYAMAGYGSSVQMLPKKEGGYFMRIASWVNTDPMPVVAGRRYRVEIKLRPDTFSGARCTVTFSDRSGKAVKNSGGLVLAKKATLGGTEVFRAPAEARQLSVMLGAADYESVRVTEEKEGVK